MTDLGKKYEKERKRRNELESHRQRLQGKREAAALALDKARQECLDKKIDPDKIDVIIAQLEEKFEKHVAEITAENDAMEQALKPFLNR